MKKNSHFFTKICILFTLLFSSLGHTYHDVLFQKEKFSWLAHKLMGDHGENAVYHVSLDDVSDFLPELHTIKRKHVQKMSQGPAPIKMVLKAYRRWLLSPDRGLDEVTPRDFFGSFKEDVPYTYVILKDRFSFTESTADSHKEKI